MSHPPRLDLDRLFANEVSGSVEAELRSHLDGCTQCREYLNSLVNEQEHLLQAKSPEAFEEMVRNRADGRKNRWLNPVWGLGFAGAAAALVLLVVLIKPFDTQDQSHRWRGSQLSIQIYQEHQGQSRLLGDRKPQVGDHLRYQVVLPPGKRAYAAVLALEQGRLLPVLPATPDAQMFVMTGSAFLPGSVELKAGGGIVKILLIVRETPFTIQTLVTEMQDSSTGWPPPGLAHEMVVNLGDAP